MSGALVWIVDDDRSIRFVLARALDQAGYLARSFDSAEAALAAWASERPAMVFTDLRMPGRSGLELLARLQAEVPVVVMSAYTDLSGTAAAFAGGAFDYLPKPFDLDRAVALVRRALEPRHRQVQTEPSAGPDLLGDSPAMREVIRLVARVARSDVPVLITGETGTGKELVARALHRLSLRADRPFVALNTAAIAPELLESELFGHEQGAFTGAQRRHPGRFEQAQGGILFLDEIGDMPAALQTRLLRVLAEGEYYRVGGRELLRADVRILAATHQDLQARVASGQFRSDLLHRLDVVRIRLPPLRERLGDIARLAERFLAEAAAEHGGEPKHFSVRAHTVLQAHDWPGNVRELRNLCLRLHVLVTGGQIDAADVAQELHRSSEAAPLGEGDWLRALQQEARQRLSRGERALYARTLAACERALLDVALEHTGGDRKRAAECLGIGRNTITRRLGPKT